MDPNNQGAEAERWLGIAVKLLTTRDFLGSRTFALRARDSDPNNHISDQILAIVDTILAADKRVESTQQPDWYSILQLPPLLSDPDLISTHYRRLSYLLDPNRNRFPFADFALQLTLDAWSVLSDPTKKWLFDNELALSLQRGPGSGSGSGSGRADGFAPGAAPGPALNTFQFLQSASPPPATQQMWQVGGGSGGGSHQLPPQWQMRDPKGKAGGFVISSQPVVQESGPPPAQMQAPEAVPASEHAPRPVPGWRVVDDARNIDDDSNYYNNVCSDSGNVNVNLNAKNVNVSVDVDVNVGDGNGGVKNNVGEKEVESFWTSCPYCLYIYEYQKMYQNCTIRCCNCKRGFHASQIPKPPVVDGSLGDKIEEGSFCCWSFFPLAFSMAAWKKHNEIRASRAPEWVPFSPMFANPVGNGGGGEGGDFHMFVNVGNACVGPRAFKRKNVVRSPRVYIEDEDLLDVSDPSDSDSSDCDWRTPASYRKRRKVRRSRRRGLRSDKTKTMENQSQGDHNNTVYGGGVSVGGENFDEDEYEMQAVVGLSACRKAVASENITSVVMRKHTRRRMKDMGNLDLNVEFNNDSDQHVHNVPAVNGDEDVIENIGFFEDLDEFLNTLPIINAVEDEKAEPS